MRGSWTSASVSRPICPSNTAAWWFHTVMLQKLFTEIYFWGHLRRETNALWRPVSRLMSCSTAANEDDYWEMLTCNKFLKKHVLLMFCVHVFSVYSQNQVTLLFLIGSDGEEDGLTHVSSQYFWLFIPSIFSSPPRSEAADIVNMIPFVADMTDENPQTVECRKRSRLTWRSQFVQF